MEEEFESIMEILSEANLIDKQYNSLDAPEANPKEYAKDSIGCNDTVCSSIAKSGQNTTNSTLSERKQSLSQMLFSDTALETQSDRYQDLFGDSDSQGESTEPNRYLSLNLKCKGSPLLT